MTQKEQILRHLKKRTTITPLEAFHLYGIYRLSEYVRQLRSEGHNITTSMKDAPNGKRYGEYKMAQTPKDVVKLPVPSAQVDHNIPSPLIATIRAGVTARDAIEKARRSA